MGPHRLRSVTAGYVDSVAVAGTNTKRHRLEITSLQAASVIDQFETRGEVRPDRTGTTEGADWVEAYRWMAGMLAEQRSVVAGFDPSAGSMFWGWVGSSPDLLGELCVPISRHDRDRLLLCTFAIEPARLLVSDFDAWDDLVNTGEPEPGWSSIFDPPAGASLQAVWSDLRAGDLIDAVEFGCLAR